MMNFDSLKDAFECIKNRGDRSQQIIQNQEVQLLRLHIPTRLEELKTEFLQESINLIFVGVRGSGKTYLIHKLMNITKDIVSTSQIAEYRLDQQVRFNQALPIHKYIKVFDTPGFEIGNQQHNNNIIEKIRKIKGEMIVIWVRTPQTYYLDEGILNQGLTESSILGSRNSLQSFQQDFQLDLSMTCSWNLQQSQSLQSKAIIVINQFLPDLKIQETNQILFKVGHGAQVYDLPIFEKYLLQQINLIYCRSFYSENYIYLYYKVARFDILHAQGRQITNAQNKINVNPIRQNLQTMTEEITNYIRNYAYYEENFKFFFRVENDILLSCNDANKIQTSINKYIQSCRQHMSCFIKAFEFRLLEETIEIICQLASQVGSEKQMLASFSMIDMAGFSLEMYPYKLAQSIIESYQEVFKLNQYLNEVNVKTNGSQNLLSSLKSMMSMIMRKPKNNISQIRDIFNKEYIDIQVLKTNLQCCNQSLLQQFEQIKKLYIEILHKVTFALKIFIDEIQSYS